MKATRLTLEFAHPNDWTPERAQAEFQRFLQRDSISVDLLIEHEIQYPKVMPLFPQDVLVSDEGREGQTLPVRIVPDSYGISLIVALPEDPDTEISRIALDLHDGQLQVLAWYPGNDDAPDVCQELVPDVFDAEAVLAEVDTYADPIPGFDDEDDL